MNPGIPLLDFTGVPEGAPPEVQLPPLGFYCLDFTGIPCGVPTTVKAPTGRVKIGVNRLLAMVLAEQEHERKQSLVKKSIRKLLAADIMADAESNFKTRQIHNAVILAEL